MLLRSPLALLAAAALAVTVGAFTAIPEAYSVSPADVQGVYVLKLNGDAWMRTRSSQDVAPQSASERVKGTAFLILTADSEVNDGSVHAEIRLGERNEGRVLDRVTGSPDFEASGAIMGDRLSLIATGNPAFVSALNLRFDRNGKRIAGAWVVAWPAENDDSAFSAGANVAFKGKRWVPRRNKPDLVLPPVEPAQSPKSIRDQQLDAR